MKDTDMIRKVDDLGRVVIPKSLRLKYGISEGDSVEISDEDGSIVMRKHGNSCVFCHSGDELIAYEGKFICSRCVDILKK